MAVQHAQAIDAQIQRGVVAARFDMNVGRALCNGRIDQILCKFFGAGVFFIAQTGKQAVLITFVQQFDDLVRGGNNFHLGQSRSKQTLAHLEHGGAAQGVGCGQYRGGVRGVLHQYCKTITPCSGPAVQVQHACGYLRQAADKCGGTRMRACVCLSLQGRHIAPPVAY